MAAQQVSVPFHVRDAVNTVMAAFVQKALARNLRLDLVWDGSIPEMMFGDVERLRRSLNSLIGDAITVANGGYVRLIVTKSPSRENTSKVMFEIQDSEGAWNFQFTAEFKMEAERELEFDPEVLQKLWDHESNGQPLGRVLTADFLRDSGALFTNLARALKEARWSEASDFAHALRGASLTLGLRGFGKICEACEANPEASDPVAIHVAWLRACDHLRKFLATPGHQVA